MAETEGDGPCLAQASKVRAAAAGGGGRLTGFFEVLYFFFRGFSVMCFLVGTRKCEVVGDGCVGVVEVERFGTVGGRAIKLPQARQR
jgi:hypothetical protein